MGNPVFIQHGALARSTLTSLYLCFWCGKEGILVRGKLWETSGVNVRKLHVKCAQWSYSHFPGFPYTSFQCINDLNELWETFGKCLNKSKHIWRCVSQNSWGTREMFIDRDAIKQWKLDGWTFRVKPVKGKKHHPPKRKTGENSSAGLARVSGHWSKIPLLNHQHLNGDTRLKTSSSK